MARYRCRCRSADSWCCADRDIARSIAYRVSLSVKPYLPIVPEITRLAYFGICASNRLIFIPLSLLAKKPIRPNHAWVSDVFNSDISDINRSNEWLYPQCISHSDGVAPSNGSFLSDAERPYGNARRQGDHLKYAP